MASFIEPFLLEGEHFSEAMRIVCCFFQVESLHREQLEALKAFFLGRNIFFSAGTGYGKSLVFQAVPLLADLLKEQVVGTSIAIIICPSVSLMLDQVAYLKSLRLNTAAVFNGQDEEVLREIEEGQYAYIYATPESMLSVKRWQKMLRTPYFKEHCVLFAVDEAHCISLWGLPGAKSMPFRKWYGNLGELRALFKDVNFIACTATATTSTKAKIFSVLQMTNKNTLEIEVSPDRANLTYVMQYVGNEIPLGDVFSEVIEQVRTEKQETPRTIIYCQTIKQCAILWRIFKLALADDLYFEQSGFIKDCLVQMFHSSTPKSTKQLILDNISQMYGNIRILICTIAFGMGIDCKGVNRIIHFGPPSTIECYVQECGRTGRDGCESTCVLLHNSFLASHCSDDMKKYLENKECQRKEILKHFPGNHVVKAQGCKCCDVCATSCTCSGKPGKCQSSLFMVTKKVEEEKYNFEMRRVVSPEQKRSLESKLTNYMTELRNKSVNPVLYPNIFFEFGKPHIAQVIQSCYQLFSIEDIQNAVEIWRTEHAKRILVILNEVFQDITDLEIEECEDECDVDSEWQEVRDDSDMNLLVNDTMDSLMMLDLSETMSEIDDSDQTVMNRSSLLNTLAVEASHHIYTNDNMES